MKIEGFSHTDAVEQIKLCQEIDPKLAMEFTIRRILPVQGWVSPMIAQAGYIAQCFQHISKDVYLSGTRANTVVMGCWLALHKWPTYFVGKDLAEMLILTDPPDDLVWSDIHWSMPAFVALMPNTPEIREHFLTPHGAPSIQAGYVRKPKSLLGKVSTVSQIMSGIRMEGSTEWLDRIVVEALYQDADLGIPVFQDLCAKPEWDFKTTASTFQYSNEAAEPMPPYSIRISDKDVERQKKFAAFIINLVTWMASENAKNQVEPSTLLRKGKTKHGGKVKIDELWSPNWLGRLYKPAYLLTTGGQHASPRAHWRRGHYRHQRFGAGLQQMRVIWIEPFLVNPSVETTKQ